jgi:hypothetical protein
LAGAGFESDRCSPRSAAAAIRQAATTTTAVASQRLSRRKAMRAMIGSGIGQWCRGFSGPCIDRQAQFLDRHSDRIAAEEAAAEPVNTGRGALSPAAGEPI